MNQYIYETMIRPFINNCDKKILQKKDCYLITFHYPKIKKVNLLHIFLHLGYPCVKRYCSCMFYEYEDILKAKNISY